MYKKKKYKHQILKQIYNLSTNSRLVDFNEYRILISCFLNYITSNVTLHTNYHTNKLLQANKYDTY